jgi:uncharacterized membrane protein
MSKQLDRWLVAVVVGVVIFYALCIWEFSIGIKESIKRLFNGKI